MDDDKGTSIVLIHSSKGKKLMNELSDKITNSVVDYEVVERYNSSAIRSSHFNNKRSSFLEEIQIGDYENIVDKYTKLNAYRRMKHLACRIKRKIFR